MTVEYEKNADKQYLRKERTAEKEESVIINKDEELTAINNRIDALNAEIDVQKAQRKALEDLEDAPKEA